MSLLPKSLKQSLQQANENPNKSLKLHQPILENLIHHNFTTDDVSATDSPTFHNTQDIFLKYLKISPDADELILILRNISTVNTTYYEKNLVLLTFIYLNRTINFSSRNSLPKNTNLTGISDKILRLGYKYFFSGLLKVTKPIAADNLNLINHVKLILTLALELSVSSKRLMEFLNVDLIKWKLIAKCDFIDFEGQESEGHPKEKKQKLSYKSKEHEHFNTLIKNLNKDNSVRDLLIALAIHTENSTLQNNILWTGYSGCKTIILKSSNLSLSSNVVNNVCKHVYGEENCAIETCDELFDKILGQGQSQKLVLNDILNSTQHFQFTLSDTLDKTEIYTKSLLFLTKFFQKYPNSTKNFGRSYFKFIKGKTNDKNVLLAEMLFLKDLKIFPEFFEKSVFNRMFAILGDGFSDLDLILDVFSVALEQEALCPDLQIILKFWSKLYNEKFYSKIDGEAENYKLAEKYFIFLNNYDLKLNLQATNSSFNPGLFAPFIHLKSVQNLLCRHKNSIQFFKNIKFYTPKSCEEKAILKIIFENRKFRESSIKSDAENFKEILVSLNLFGPKELKNTADAGIFKKFLKIFFEKFTKSGEPNEFLGKIKNIYQNQSLAIEMAGEKGLIYSNFDIKGRDFCALFVYQKVSIS